VGHEQKIVVQSFRESGRALQWPARDFHLRARGHRRLGGPIFKFSDTWQLIINTSTTIITFLMVFLIQNTQNRDAEAIQIKLDELIRVTKGAHTVLLDLEELDDKHLMKIKACYEEIAMESRAALKRGKKDTGTPFVHIEMA